MPAPLRVLFVCLGNICRSPTARAVFAHEVARAGLADRIEVDAAGMGGHFAGEAADRHAQRAARRRGYALTGTARQVTDDDLARFDLILAMEHAQVRALRHRAPARAGRIRAFMEMVPGRENEDMPDPYGGGAQGFEEVLDLCERGAQRLLDELRAQLPD